MLMMQPRRCTNIMKQMLLLILFALCMAGALGCADHSSAKTKELLANDYQSLSNDELTLYYYQLEDQIELVERSKSKPTLSLGLGMGSFGSRSGTSGGVGVSTGRNSGEFATDLRDRRNKVKMELKKRGISP